MKKLDFFWLTYSTSNQFESLCFYRNYPGICSEL